MGKMAEIRAMKEALEQKIKDEGQNALKEAFGVFFWSNPTVEAVRWTQYTPYFNDGDPCTFSVHEFRYKIQGGDPDGGDYEDGYESRWGLRNSPLKEAVTQFEKEISDNDVFEAIFGDHVQVTATRDGFSVEEHSHD